MSTPPPTANLQALMAQLASATPNSPIIGSATGGPASGPFAGPDGDQGLPTPAQAPDTAIA